MDWHLKRLQEGKRTFCWSAVGFTVAPWFLMYVLSGGAADQSARLKLNKQATGTQRSLAEQNPPELLKLLNRIFIDPYKKFAKCFSTRLFWSATRDASPQSGEQNNQTSDILIFFYYLFIYFFSLAAVWFRLTPAWFCPSASAVNRKNKKYYKLQRENPAFRFLHEE